jgi:Family of unknown function (DUF6578)
VIAVVWVASWQMECCGDPFAVGERVTWTTDDEVDDEWFVGALGLEKASRITHSEEHHADRKDDLTEITGRVLSITRAWGAYGPRNPGGQIHYPLADSQRFLNVRESNGVERYAFSDLTFNGWIVELALYE